MGPPGSRVVLGFWRECDHGLKQEFKVELVREFNQLTETGGQVGKWEGVEVEALRMQILLLKEEATRHRETQVRVCVCVCVCERERERERERESARARDRATERERVCTYVLQCMYEF